MDISTDTDTFGHRGCEGLDPLEVNLHSLRVGKVNLCNWQAAPCRDVVRGDLGDRGLELAWRVGWLDQAHSALDRRRQTGHAAL